MNFPRILQVDTPSDRSIFQRQSSYTMANDRFEGTSPPKPDTDSAYTSLSSLLKPSPKKPQQGKQQKLLAPTPRRQGNPDRLYTVSERSEGSSSRNSPNLHSRERDQHNGQLMVGEDRRSRSRSPAGGNQAVKKRSAGKKSVWSLIALTISMGGAQVRHIFAAVRRLLTLGVR